MTASTLASTLRLLEAEKQSFSGYFAAGSFSELDLYLCLRTTAQALLPVRTLWSSPDIIEQSSWAYYLPGEQNIGYAHIANAYFFFVSGEADYLRA